MAGAAFLVLLAAAFGCARTAAPAPPSPWPSPQSARLVLSGCRAGDLGWCAVACIGPCAGDAAPEAPVVDVQSRPGACLISGDGFVWYAPGTRRFPPVLAAAAACSAGATVAADADPPVPRWASPHGPTRALFVAGTLQDDLSPGGTRAVEAIAARAGVPLTWMLGNLRQLRRNGAFYDATHRVRGDDLQIEPYDDLRAAVARRLPWFRLVSTIDGGGHERDVAHDLRMGARAFWGIAWNSNGVDGIADRGAPWGAYCADPASYKRPEPDGGCRLLGIEWTARDLTRAYLSGREDAYSTDPSDLHDRARMGAAAVGAYVRRLVDAYAAAGETTPLLLLAQQESAEVGADPLANTAALAPLYEEAVRTHMRATTLGEAVAMLRTVAGRPRAVAFPYLPDVPEVFAGFPGPAAPWPATLDYSDRRVGLTFLAGRLTPVRAFPYAEASTSVWNRPLAQLPPADLPAVVAVAREPGRLVVRLQVPVAGRTGLALWAAPRVLGWSARPVRPAGFVAAAGRAASVAVVDLPTGEADVELDCRRCGDASLPLAP